MGVGRRRAGAARDAADARPHRRSARRASRRARSFRALLRDGTIRLALAMNGARDADGVPRHPQHRRRTCSRTSASRAAGSTCGYMVGGAASFLDHAHRGPRHRPLRRRARRRRRNRGHDRRALLRASSRRARSASRGVLVVFVLFMGGMSIRNVSMSSLSTRVPRADQRAGYMSLQSTAQHISSATGAFASSRLLHERPGGRLAGISTVAIDLGGAGAGAAAAARRHRQARQRARSRGSRSADADATPRTSARGVEAEHLFGDGKSPSMAHPRSAEKSVRVQTSLGIRIVKLSIPPSDMKRLTAKNTPALNPALNPLQCSWFYVLRPCCRAGCSCVAGEEPSFGPMTNSPGANWRVKQRAEREVELGRPLDARRPTARF